MTRGIVVRTHDDGVNAWGRADVAPAAVLAGAIDGYCDYWERVGGFTTRRELPHAEGVMIVNLGAPIAITSGDGAVMRLAAGEAFVAGAHLRAALSHCDGAQAGIHINLPLTTLRRLLGLPMDRLRDRVVKLDALLGAEARDLGQRLGEAKDVAERAALLDVALARRLADAPALSPTVARALQLLRSRPGRDIADVADDVGWSRKHLAARVEDAVGVGPRCFRRLLRFQRLMGLVMAADVPDWPGLALAAGYCDQSHLIREFREFSGLTPSEYLARRLPDGGGVVES